MPRVLAIVTAGLLTLAAAAAPKPHRLAAPPSTIAYGWYDAAAAPVLHIASGDVIDVDTLLTNTPAGLARAGVPDDQIQASLKAIVGRTPPEKKGPGGHILTGPIFVDGAEPGDALEVRILSIDLAIAYGYNGCSGFPPRELGADQPHSHHPARPEDDDRDVRPRHRDPAAAVLREHGRGATARCRTHQPQPAVDQLTSIAGDVHITQLVDGKVGVHVKMPKEIFR